jgi:hypothetical protein
MIASRSRRFGQILERTARCSDRLRMIRRDQLRRGDFLTVRTSNSLYTIRVLGNDRFLVSGGWFDANGSGPVETRISGCTWGGSVIKRDVVAACGLCIEFGNRVTTSLVRRIVMTSGAVRN